MRHGESDSVLDRLPHREPFRFLTEVVELHPGVSGTARWSVRGDEPFFAGHFPGDPVVPGVLIGEALAQLSGLVGLHCQAGDSGAPSTGGRLAHLDLRIDRAVAPPACILLRSTLTRSMGGLRQFEVSAIVGDQTVARGTLVLALIEATSGAGPARKGI